MIGRLALAATALALLAAAPAQAAPPTITYTLTGTAGTGDWFRSAVTVKWTVTGDMSSSGCDTQTITSDTTGTTRTCTGTNGDGVNAVTTKIIKIDQAAPTGVAPLAARPADFAGWYTAPLPITWSGTDATSGIAACTTLTYAGPDGAGVTPSGICRDNAGNESPAAALTISYDATAPALTDVRATATRSAATVRWAPAPDVQRVTVTREPGDGEAPSKVIADGPQGQPSLVDRGLVGGKAYTWIVTVRDAAGNATTARASATPHAPVSATAAARRVLTWKRRAKARYYNFQLLRKGRKILSVWPSKPRYALKTSWRFRGKRYRLTPGVYAWYVWPGYGARHLRRYGRLHAQGTFRVR